MGGRRRTGERNNRVNSMAVNGQSHTVGVALPVNACLSFLPALMPAQSFGGPWLGVDHVYHRLLGILGTITQNAFDSRSNAKQSRVFLDEAYKLNRNRQAIFPSCYRQGNRGIMQ